MSKFSCIALGSLILFANTILYPVGEWQETALSCSVALLFTLILATLYKIQGRLVALPFCILLIPLASLELLRFSSQSAGFLAESKLTILIAAGAISAFMLYAGAKSSAFLSQLLFLIIPIVFFFFAISPFANKLTLIPEAGFQIKAVRYSLTLIAPIFALFVITKHSGSTRGTFLLGATAGLIFVLLQGFVYSAFGSEAVTGRHPLLVCAARSSYPIDTLLVGATTFAGILRLGLFLIASGLPLKHTKHKNLYILSLYFLSAGLIYFSFSA